MTAVETGPGADMKDTWNFIPLPFRSIVQIVADHSEYRPNLPAFCDETECVSWSALSGRVQAMAAWMVGRGVRRGDRVVLLAGNSVWAYEALLAVLHAGAIPAPLSPLLSPHSLGRMFDDCKPRLALAMPPLMDLLRAGMSHAEIGCEMASQADMTVGVESHACAAAAPGDAASIIYSSGTTGDPKGIVHTHQARMWMAASLAAGLRYDEGSRTLLATPPFTNGTWMMLLPALVSGSASYVQPRFDAGQTLEIIAREKITHAFLVPTQFQALAAHPAWADADLSSLEVVVSAGAPLPDSLKQHVMQRLPGVLHELWGLTEGVATIATPADLEARPGTVGRASGGTSIRLLREDGTPAGPGETGEIAGTSLALMAGYLNKAERTRELLWQDEAGQTYLRTGDIGELDAEGYLFLRGRKKDMIISGGLNIYPVDLESVLVAHPAVLDAAVVGAPHEKWGETPIGFVTLAPAAQVSADEIKSWAETRLDRHQRLADLVILKQDFPRNALGKILKQPLLDAYTAPAPSNCTPS